MRPLRAPIVLFALAACTGGGPDVADTDTDAADTDTDGADSDTDGADSDTDVPPDVEAVLVSERLVPQGTVAYSDAPVTLAHAFPEGAVPEAAALRLVGAESALVTQLDVRRRWPDGSVKFAQMSARFPSVNPGEPLDVEVVRTAAPPTGPGGGLEDVLAAGLDATVTFQTDAGPFAATLSTAATDGQAPVAWLSGPVLTELHDRFVPVGTDGAPHPQLRVDFRVRWPTSDPSSARVEVVVENLWADARGDVPYDVQIALEGHGEEPEIVWSQADVVHYHNARWHRTFDWGVATAPIDPVYDLAYLTSTGLLPRYDRAVTPTEASLAADHERFLSSNHGILGPAIVQTYFPTTGGRDDIGPYPAWTVRYLLTMDPRAREVMLGAGDAAGSFSIHLVERGPDRVVSIDDRPTCSPWGDQRYADPGDPLPAPVGPTTSPYTTDNAHQPSLAYVPYLVTGDRYYLEEVVYWASYTLLSQSYVSLDWGRDGANGYVRGDQVRGQAWALRQLGDAAAIAPDGSFEQAYFTEKVTNNLRHYTDTMRAAPNPLGWWGEQSNWGSDGGRPDAAMDAEVRYYTSPWMSDFLVWSFDHLVDLGFSDAREPRDWLMAFTIGRFTHGPGFNPYDGAAYHLAVRSTDGTAYGDWPTMWQKSFANREGPAPTALSDASCAYCYGFIARAALTGGVRDGVPGAAEAKAFLDANLALDAMAGSPTFALVP